MYASRFDVWFTYVPQEKDIVNVAFPIGDKHNYTPVSQPMVKETHSKVLRLITDRYGTD